MKTLKLILLLILLGTCDLSAQHLELVRPAEFRYHVTVDSDTVSSRSLDYKAIQDAIIYRSMFPNSHIVVHPLGMEVRGSVSWTAPPDTIVIRDTIETVRIDTVEVDVPGDTTIVKQYDASYNFSDNPFPDAIALLNPEVRQQLSDTTGSYQLAIDGTTSASAVSVATNCFGFYATRRDSIINERTGGLFSAPDSTGYTRWESEPLQCRGIMTMWITERDSGNFAVRFLDIGQILSLE